MKMNVFIVGGSKGIGKRVAQQCINLGHNVGLTSRSAESAKAVVGQLEGSNSVKTLGIPCDVTEPESVREAFAVHKQEFPSLDAYIHCAGQAANGLLLRSSAESIENSLKVNLHGAIYGTQQAIQRMIRQKSGGSVLCVGSVVGSLGNRGQSIYAASKSGLSGFVKSVSAEVASRNVRVNVVEPGLVETEMFEESLKQQLGEKELKELQEKITGGIPLGRRAQAHEIADAICWISGLYSYKGEDQSEHRSAAYVTGSVIPVHGALGTGMF